MFEIIMNHAVRSIILLQGKSVSVKTVDTALKLKKKNDEMVALDSRCADINAEVRY